MTEFEVIVLVQLTLLIAMLFGLAGQLYVITKLLLAAIAHRTDEGTWLVRP